MKLNVHDIISVQFSKNLIALKGVLSKAKEHAEARKFDENLFLQLRTAPDMFPLVRQVQITTDTAKGAAARLSGKEAPIFEDKETTLADLLTRIDKTVSFLNSVSATDFEGYEGRTMSFHWNPKMHLKGADFLISYAIPNFYFHSTTVYALLRGAGVEIGKGDFLGEVNWIRN